MTVQLIDKQVVPDNWYIILQPKDPAKPDVDWLEAGRLVVRGALGGPTVEHWLLYTNGTDHGGDGRSATIAFRHLGSDKKSPTPSAVGLVKKGKWDTFEAPKAPVEWEWIRAACAKGVRNEVPCDPYP